MNRTICMSANGRSLLSKTVLISIMALEQSPKNYAYHWGLLIINAFAESLSNGSEKKYP